MLCIVMCHDNGCHETHNIWFDLVWKDVTSIVVAFLAKVYPSLAGGSSGY